MSDAIQSAILVLSDLHFGTDFLLEAEIEPYQMPAALNSAAAWSRRFFESACASHDTAILINLPKYLKKVLRQIQANKFPREKFDFMVLLGDLATYTNGGAYAFLRQYLFEHTYEWAPGRRINGLQGIYSNVIAIPGNHDKLLRKNLDLYHSKFSSHTTIGSQPKPQGSRLISHTINGLEFLFVLVEGSRYASTDLNLDLSALRHLASGEITTELRDDLKTKIEIAKRGHAVDQAKIGNWALARKVLLVHYAVDDRAVLGGLGNPIKAWFHKCEGLDSLIRDLGPSIDMVLHGHLHYPRIYNHYGVQVISAATASQKGSLNGFFILKFLASGDIAVEHHKWNQNGFVNDGTSDLNVRIAAKPDSQNDKSAAISGG